MNSSKHGGIVIPKLNSNRLKIKNHLNRISEEKLDYIRNSLRLKPIESSDKLTIRTDLSNYEQNINTKCSQNIKANVYKEIIPLIKLKHHSKDQESKDFSQYGRNLSHDFKKINKFSDHNIDDNQTKEI